MGNNVILKHMKIKVCCCNFFKWVSIHLRPNWEETKMLAKSDSISLLFLFSLASQTAEISLFTSFPPPFQTQH